MRLYGKELNSWTSVVEGKKFPVTIQMEYAYKDYRNDGTLKDAGSEDFTPERWKTEVRRAFAYVWDGKKYNKGGHRWFDCVGFVQYRRSEVKEVKGYLKRKYGCVLVDLR